MPPISVNEMTDSPMTYALPRAPTALDVGYDGHVLALDARQRKVLLIVGGALIVALAAPYPLTKLILGATLAAYGLSLLIEFDERLVGIYVLLLPVLQLAPLEMLGVPGLNWQTLFLVLFAGAAFAGSPPHSSIAVPKWIAYFSIVVTLSATYSWLALGKPAEPLFTTVKNWLFPFAMFFLGYRCFRQRSQLWLLILCVAIVSLAQSLQALSEAVVDGNLLRHRPKGILTGQANLFGGI